jgi:hypothetical protein
MANCSPCIGGQKSRHRMNLRGREVWGGRLRAERYAAGVCRLGWRPADGAGAEGLVSGWESGSGAALYFARTRGKHADGAHARHLPGAGRESDLCHRSGDRKSCALGRDYEQHDRPLTVVQAEAATWNLPASSDYVLRYLLGRWGGEFQVEDCAIQPGATVLESRRGMTGHQFSPRFAVAQDTSATK